MNGLRITLAAGVAAALACTSMAATARADEEKGLAVGVRVGYAIPFGDAQSTSGGPTSVSVSMSHLQRGMLPVWFDLGYRFSPRVYLGLFYQYAPTFPASGNCAQTVANGGVAGQTTCDGSDQRFGLNLHYHLMPKEFVDPWIGIGIGYEITRLNYATGASSDTSSFQASGLQFFDIQLGADLRFSKRIPIGPFLDFSLGQFGTENNYNPNGQGTPVDYKGSFHEWLTLGIRSQFNL